jgi:chromosome partitioning protein
MNINTHVITFANQKGGVGKTATSCQFAIWLSEIGKRVLFIDADAQRTATNCLKQRDDVTVAAFFSDALFGGVTKAALKAGKLKTDQTKVGISLVAASKDLWKVDAKNLRHDVLKGNIALIEGEYDFVVIDSPPTFGARLENILHAANFVAMPFAPVHESTDGIADLMDSIDDAKKNNKGLKIVGLIINKINPRSAEQSKTIEQLKGLAGALLMKERLHDRTALTDALALGRAVWEKPKGASHRLAASEMMALCQQLYLNCK